MLVGGKKRGSEVLGRGRGSWVVGRGSERQFLRPPTSDLNLQVATITPPHFSVLIPAIPTTRKIQIRSRCKNPSRIADNSMMVPDALQFLQPGAPQGIADQTTAHRMGRASAIWNNTCCTAENTPQEARSRSSRHRRSQRLAAGSGMETQRGGPSARRLLNRLKAAG